MQCPLVISYSTSYSSLVSLLFQQLKVSSDYLQTAQTWANAGVVVL